MESHRAHRVDDYHRSHPALAPRQGKWTQEESLATIGVAEFVELPEEKVVYSHVGDGHEHFFACLGRQLIEARVRFLLTY
jgi:hypothetical protein